VIATPLAWSVRLARREPWMRLAFLALCLTIPGPLLGIGLIRLLNQPPDSPLADLAWLYDSNFAPWVVQTVRALPLVTLILWPALASVPQVMLDAAATDGTGWWGRLLRVALPQRWPAVAAAWLVGLAVAVGELAATVLVMPPQRSTAISVRVFQLLHYGVDDRVAAICLVMVAGVAALTGIAAALLKRKM
jgi:ABC-type Fe3+ transport system permease subunit